MQASRQGFKNPTDLSWARGYITSCLQIGFCTPDTFVCSENFNGKKKLIHLVIKIEPSLKLKTPQPKYLDTTSHFIVGWGKVKYLSSNVFISVDAAIDLRKTRWWNTVILLTAGCIVLLASLSCSCCIQRRYWNIIHVFFLKHHELGYYSKKKR